MEPPDLVVGRAGGAGEVESLLVPARGFGERETRGGVVSGASCVLGRRAV